MTEKKVFKVRCEAEILATDRDEAEDYICNVMDQLFIYGIGKQFVENDNDYEGKHEKVTRLIDFDILLEDGQ